MKIQQLFRRHLWLIAVNALSVAVFLHPPPLGALRSLLTASEASPSTSEIQDPTAAPLCKGVRVVAISSSSDPNRSLASLVPEDTESPVMRRRGGMFDGKTVSFIGYDRVWLVDMKDGLCQATMGRSS
jgi:hypothetical protein